MVPLHWNEQEMEFAEMKLCDAFAQDPVGCRGELTAKRRTREPFTEDAPYSSRVKTLGAFRSHVDTCAHRRSIREGATMLSGCRANMKTYENGVNSGTFDAKGRPPRRTKECASIFSCQKFAAAFSANKPFPHFPFQSRECRRSLW